MKKIYSLLSVIALTAISANAQNLVPNGTFEAWTAGAPEGFTITQQNATTGSVTQESGAANVHGGASSAKVMAPAGTGHVRMAVTDIPVTGGHSYTFSYWFKDESDNARGRHWAAWRDNNNTTSPQLDNNADVLRPDYYPNSTGWQLVTYTLSAPAAATHFRIDFRIYQETTGQDSGLIYYDDLSFVDNSVAGVKDNMIAGLKLYPNPLTGNVLNISTDANAVKTVAIYDVLGKQVLNTTTANTSINASNLTSGVYMVKITEEGKTATKKLVVQ
ncbi:T9SS type A sorting domain-containing protein [Flavobacterium sp. DGU11]|uniref:T9SS type A sorting domain-containing protein n=1 Tax=Flavobacterium arundinis TaxID=3139143 RepID=A0ABU9I0E4_9FLAO